MANKALAVSIIIPAYNEERHLKACLDAIKRQTIMPDEVLLVDNNSTDKTVAIAGKYPFVTVVHEPRQGIVYARNRGFNAAKGNILGRIDVDTRLPDDWVERVRQFYLPAPHHDFALTGGCYFYNVRLPRVDHWITSQFVFRMNRLMVGHYILWGSNMAMPAKLWRAVKKDVCLRNDIHEDLDLSMHLHRRNYQIYYQASLIVGARMAHVFERDGQLWNYLKMWPRTLKVHNFETWPLSYVGAGFLWVAQIVPRGLERISIWLGKTPLN